MKRQHWLAAYLFIAPVLVFFVLFRIYPMVFDLSLTFMEWDLLANETKWVGIRHYLKLANDTDFLDAFGNTLLYTVVMTPLAVIVGLGLALLLNMKIPARAFSRSAFFLPVVTSLVAVATVWRWLYEPSHGMFNALLRQVGLPTSKWLSVPQTAMLSVIIFGVWQRMGWAMVIFLAGLQAIPHQYYEAAEIDGASKFRRFTSITLPLLMPTTFFAVVMTTIASLMVFDQIWMMTRGGPADATLVLVLYIYRLAFSFFKFGYAATVTLILFLFILAVSIVEMKILGRRETEYF